MDEELTFMSTPVVIAESAILTTVAATAAVDERSNIVPFVAPPVSFDVELRRRSEPVSAMTDVVWDKINPWPVVRAFNGTLMPMPVVRAAKGIYTAVPVVRPEGVIVTNDVVVDPVNTPEPATANTVALVAVLLVNTTVEAAFEAAVIRSFPLETTMSPRDTVKAAVAKALPAIVVAPLAATLNTEVLPPESHAFI